MQFVLTGYVVHMRALLTTWTTWWYGGEWANSTLWNINCPDDMVESDGAKLLLALFYSRTCCRTIIVGQCQKINIPMHVVYPTNTDQMCGTVRRRRVSMSYLSVRIYVTGRACFRLTDLLYNRFFCNLWAVWVRVSEQTLSRMQPYDHLLHL